MLKDQIPPRGSLRDKDQDNAQGSNSKIQGLDFGDWILVIVLEFGA